jgi:hypothetical protein
MLTAIIHCNCGGNSYLWSNGATTSSITVLAPQTDSVTITDGSGCLSTSSATNVTTVLPDPAPVITPGGATTICDGDSVVLTSSAATGYNWSNGATTQSITVKASNNYAVTVTNANGCSASSSNTTVIIHSNPFPPTIKQFHDSLKSSFTTGNQWYLNGGIISGATGQFYVVTQNGIYTVKYTNSNGCSSTSAPFNITNVGITELTGENSFSIYPNPANQSIVISLQSAVNPVGWTSNGVNKKIEITIIDVLGEKVYMRQFTSGNPQSAIEVDVSSFPAGMYFLQMRTEGAIATQRFVKE